MEEDIYHIFSKEFFQKKTLFCDEDNFIWKSECNIISNLNEADILVLKHLNEPYYKNELIITTHKLLYETDIRHMDNYYHLNIYNYIIYFNKDSLFGFFKNKGLRDYVCLTFYLTITLNDMTLEYAIEQSKNIYLHESYKNNSQAKYAIVLMGLPRTYKYIYPFLYNEWISGVQPDIYITTEETNTDDINNIKELYRPKYIYLSSKTELYEQVNKWNCIHPKQDINYHYTNINKYRVYKISDYIDTTNYDFIILLRTDVTILRMFDIDTFDKTAIYTKHDMISIIPSNLFKQYSLLNDCLYSYHTIIDKVWPATPWVNENRLPNDWVYTPENQLFQHIIKITNNNWKPHFIPFFIQYLYRNNNLRWMISYNL